MRSSALLCFILSSYDVIIPAASAPSAAFIPPPRKCSYATLILMKRQRPDSSNDVEEAIRLSKEFGLNSEEAKVAWDIVEEIDASDSNRYVT
jgi:hypothetical protein